MRTGSEQDDMQDDSEVNGALIGRDEDQSNCWIFIVVDHLIGSRTVSAMDVLKDRLERKIWIVNSKNPNVKHLREGDEVIFYLGRSRRERGFIGIGVLASKPRSLMKLDGVEYASPSSKFDQVVELRDVKLWEKVKPVVKIVPRLGFIKNKRNWGIYLQGGIVRIFKRDFELIVEA